MRISITGKTERLLREAMAITGITSPNEAIAFVLNRYLPDLQRWYGAQPAVTAPPLVRPPSATIAVEELEPISL